MKLYTKTGDDGSTGLYAGPRVQKDDPRIEAYGEVDELNCVLGLARASDLPPEIDALLAHVQNELFSLGAELATPDPIGKGTAMLGDEHVTALEQAIDQFDASLPPLRAFILPGGSLAASHLHLARTVCRRAERRLVTAMRESQSPISTRLLIYLNRLSDLLFVLARAANQAVDRVDVEWNKPRSATV